MLKPTRQSLAVFVALATSAAVVAPATAQELTGTMKKIKDSGSITVGHRDASIPFSYLDDKQQPIGYSMDLCAKIVDAVKANLKLPALKVNYQVVTSATRIPLLANGTVDMECGSTTNNAERQKQISYVVTTFVTANRYVAKKASKVTKLDDLKGKTVTSTAGTTNIKWLTETNAGKNMGMSIIPGKDHAESFLNVETDRAVAFFMDDILLAGLVANSKTPGDFMVGSEAYSVEPYGIMVRKDDAQFKKLADDTIKGLMKSGEIEKIYAKWFLAPIPPKNINMNTPISPQLKKVFANPTDSPDPAVYQ